MSSASTLEMYETELRHHVDINLRQYLSVNAIFFAERLYHLRSTEANRHVLAKCFYQIGKFKQTYLILQGSQSNENCYLLALVCIELLKYDEAESALLKQSFKLPKDLTLDDLKAIPGGSAGLYLLGRIARKQHRDEVAIQYFNLSLQLNNVMWSAVLELCELGVDMSKYFKLNSNEAVECFHSFFVDSNSTEKHSFDENNIQNQITFQNENIPPIVNRRFTSNPNQPVEKNDRHSKALLERSGADHNAYASVLSAVNGKPSSLVSTPYAIANVKGADTTVDVTSPCPRTAVSLGLSSTSFHVPFTSPSLGTVVNKSTLPTFHSGFSTVHSSCVKSLDGQEATNNDWQQYPSGSIRSSVDLANSDLSISRELNVHTYNNAISLNLSPALTPIQSIMSHSQTFLSGQYLVSPQETHPYLASQGSNLEGRMHTEYVSRNLGFNDSSSKLADDTPVISRSTSLTPGASKNCETGEAGVLKANTMTNQQLGSTVTDVSVAIGSISESSVPGKGNRRVNFGPTARLSFSSVTGIGNDDILRNQNIARNSANLNIQASNDNFNKVGIDGVGRGYDEHPSKLMKTDIYQHLNYRTNADGMNNQSDLNLHANLLDSEVSFHGSDSTLFLTSIISIFTTAISYLNTYQCQLCISFLHTLPSVLFYSGYAQQIIGKAYFELNDYKAAVLAYREMLKLEPHRIQGLEYLSSALWHLRREKDLCSLAQQIVAIDKFTPETWCIVGNCFSLLHEPDNAIRFFLRAIQVDNSYTYAHTLLGHEYVNNEDFDKAIQSFRNAILHDKRHYNAWYGLGTIYYRQEKYELSETHFRHATTINPSSSVLACYLAMVLYAQRVDIKSKEAVDVLDRAIQFDVKNPQLHFQKAHILVSNENYVEAAAALQTVRSLAPREPPVYTLLGKVYQKLDKKDEAIIYYQYAIDLDPKEAVEIKSAMETIEVPDLNELLERFLD